MASKFAANENKAASLLCCRVVNYGLMFEGARRQATNLLHGAGVA